MFQGQQQHLYQHHQDLAKMGVGTGGFSQVPHSRDGAVAYQALRRAHSDPMVQRALGWRL